MGTKQNEMAGIFLKDSFEVLKLNCMDWNRVAKGIVCRDNREQVILEDYSFLQKITYNLILTYYQNCTYS